MKRIITTGTLMLLLLAGCAGISKFSNSTLFEEVHRAYRLALRDSDFKAAQLVLDPSKKSADEDDQQYKDIKLARYKVVKTQMNDQGSEVRQEVEIQYYHQNRPVIKYLWDKQIWQYQADKSNWFLQTGLPDFK